MSAFPDINQLYLSIRNHLVHKCTIADSSPLNVNSVSPPNQILFFLVSLSSLSKKTFGFIYLCFGYFFPKTHKQTSYFLINQQNNFLQTHHKKISGFRTTHFLPSLAFLNIAHFKIFGFPKIWNASKLVVPYPCILYHPPPTALLHPGVQARLDALFKQRLLIREDVDDCQPLELGPDCMFIVHTFAHSLFSKFHNLRDIVTCNYPQLDTHPWQFFRKGIYRQMHTTILLGSPDHSPYNFLACDNFSEGRQDCLICFIGDTRTHAEWWTILYSDVRVVLYQRFW